MAGINDVAIVVALEPIVQAMQNQPNVAGNETNHNLSTFQRENPPSFNGRHDPNGAQAWLTEIEMIFG